MHQKHAGAVAHSQSGKLRSLTGDLRELGECLQQRPEIVHRRDEIGNEIHGLVERTFEDRSVNRPAVAAIDRRMPIRLVQEHRFGKAAAAAGLARMPSLRRLISEEDPVVEGGMKRPGKRVVAASPDISVDPKGLLPFGVDPAAWR